MIERSINQSRHATKVASSNATKRLPIELSASDAALAREFIRYAAESMRLVLADETRYSAKEGYERPIIASIRAYIKDAQALLDRLT